MKKLITVSLLSLMSMGLFAQRATNHYNIHSRTVDLNEKMLAFGLTEAQFEAIKDEAYANPNFLPGSIYQGEEIVRSGIQMRYNTYADEIEIKEKPSSKDFGALVKDPDIFVKIGNNIYVFVPHEQSPDKSGYFNVLFAGERYDLYKRTISTFIEAKEAQSSYDRATPPSFKKSTTYYLVDNGTFLEIPNTRSKIMNMMSSKKKEMHQYVKSNKLDVRKEADLIKALQHFDSLQ